MSRLRNPAPLGVLVGPGISPAHKNFPEHEETQFIEISFQLETDSHAIVGYADMDPETGQGVLRHLFSPGDSFDIRLESCGKELVLGDFAIHLDSENDRAIVTARW